MTSTCYSCGCGQNQCRCTKCHPEDYKRYGDYCFVPHFDRQSREQYPFGIQLDYSKHTFVYDKCAYCADYIKASDNRHWYHYILRPCHHSMHADCVLQAMMKNGLTKNGEIYCPLCYHKQNLANGTLINGTEFKGELSSVLQH